MTLDIGPQNAPDLVAGLGMLALAALVLWVVPANRVHRAFALLVVVTAGGSFAFVGTLGFERTDPLLATAFLNSNTYFTLAWPFAAAFFALRFLDPEGRSRISRPLAWCLLAGVTAVLGAFALDHSLYTFYGPLGLVWHARPLIYASMALLFVMAARRAEAAARRDGLVLASLAFTLVAALWSAARASSPVVAPVSAGDGHPAVFLLAHGFPWFGALAVLAAVGLALVAPPLRGDRTTQRSRRLLGIGAAVSGLSGVAAAQLALLDPAVFARAPNTLDGVYRVAMTALLAYALLRRQLFDVEVRLRFAISRSTIVAVFIAAFFIASEAAQQFFGETIGSTYAGIVAAGALVFAIAPLQRAAERLAERAVPVTAPVTPAPAAEDQREKLYLNALHVALRDKRLTREEEAHLYRLAAGLGIDAGRTHDLFVQAERECAEAVQEVR